MSTESSTVEADSTIEDDSKLLRRLEVGLCNLGYFEGVAAFRESYETGGSLEFLVGFVESASNEGFRLRDVTVVLRKRIQPLL